MVLKMVGNICHNAGTTVTVGNTSINMDVEIFRYLTTGVIKYQNI